MEIRYAFVKELPELEYDDAVSRATELLANEGFGVLTEIDVKGTLKAKVGADFRKYVILGACNPNLAHQALTTDLNIGLLLPCNVIGYEENGGSVVSIVDPLQMLSVADQSSLAHVADEARTKLARVVAALESKG